MTDAHAAFDLLVVGGGINGTGIARDAAGRGYRVMLVEMGDLASGTSSAATKLVHGGLRYLEQYEFRLVHEALGEREVLWASAPHIIWPLRFVLPHHKGLRPAWFLRLGLVVYDMLGGRKALPGTRTLDLRKDEAGAPLKADFFKAFEYSDCWVDDARMVVANARDAQDKGARIEVGTRLTAAYRDGKGIWHAEIAKGGKSETVTARMVINAAGPWVDDVIALTGKATPHNVRLVKGSHIVTRKLFDHDRCYIFQNGDGRIIFAIPYEGDFTLVGTTDEDFTGDPSQAAISDAEIDYLCSAASEYFRNPVKREDIVWSYAGIRPLFDDNASAAQQATRDYVLKTDGDAATGAMLNVFGGKLTTYRRLAEEAVRHVQQILGAKGPAWTKGATLPGGNFPATDFAELVSGYRRRWPKLPPALLQRLSRLYGTEVPRILGDAEDVGGLGEHFGAGLYRAELEHLIQHEWARTADDVLWRRTKLGLRMSPEEAQRLSTFMAKRCAGI